MSAYQRFISYIYAYSSEGKGRNVGFAKVEIRGEQKRIGISLKGIYGIEQMQTAIFWRSGRRVELLTFGNISIYAGNAQAQYILNNDLFREYGRGLEDASGIIICPDKEETHAYVTVWDEEEFDLSMMEAAVQDEYIETYHNTREEEIHCEYVHSSEEEIIENNSESELESEDKTLKNDDSMNKSEQEDKILKNDDSMNQLESETEILKNNNSTEQDKQQNEQRIQEQLLHALLKQLKGESQNEETGNEIKQEQVPQGEELFTAAEVKSIQEEKREENEVLWNSMYKIYPEAEPFQAEDTVKCLKIKPGSIGRLPRQNWIFANNNFVLYGYMKYHYLIFAKVGDQYMLGVPGKLSKSQKVLANQFGFDQYYPVNEKQGYWCVTIA